jgi:hypothetical protein
MCHFCNVFPQNFRRIDVLKKLHVFTFYTGIVLPSSTIQTTIHVLKVTGTDRLIMAPGAGPCKENEVL